MKLILIAFIFSISSYSQINPVICEQDIVEKLAGGLSLPNCANTRVGRNPLTRDEAICKTCKDKFAALYPDQISSLGKEDLKKKFLKVSLQEYRKSLINNVVNAVKIRSLPATGSEFKSSIQSCSFKKISDFRNGCKNPRNLALLESDPLFKNLNQEIANEVATFVNTKNGFMARPTLLDRTENKCSISEQQLVYIISSTTEEEFSPKIIEFLKNIDLQNYSSAESIIQSQAFKSLYTSDGNDLLGSVKNHPILSKHFESAESIKNFFSTIKAPYSKNNLKAQIYSKAEGDKLDEKLASNCNNSFKKLKDLVCEDAFDQGHISLDPVTNYRKLFNQDFENVPGEFASDQEMVNKNLTLFQYCGEYSDTSLRLKEESKEISDGIEDRYKEMSLPDYVSEKYSSEIQNPSENVCGTQCVEGTLSCKVKAKFDKLKDPTSEEYKLATSSNLAGNSLLRSMIGDKTNLNSKTVEVLVAAGILPREDGTLVPQPDIPERRQDYFTNEVKRENIAAGRVQGVAPGTKVGATRRTDVPEAPYVQNQNAVVGTADGSSNQATEQTESLADIEDEIRRRLSEIPRGVPQNRNQARSIVRKAARDTGRTITPAQENNIIDQMMNNVYSPQLPGIGRSIASTDVPSVSNTPTLAEKFRAGQRDEALAGMAGANQTPTSDIIDQATANSPKALTTVALNIAEDPRITLSDIFNDKITRNDAETQLIKVLLRNRKDFVLRLNNMNFKVIFDQKNSFNVLLEPGTGESALRYKPQLEIFLKRLRV